MFNQITTKQQFALMWYNCVDAGQDPGLCHDDLGVVVGVGDPRQGPGVHETAELLEDGGVVGLKKCVDVEWIISIDVGQSRVEYFEGDTVQDAAVFRIQMSLHTLVVLNATTLVDLKISGTSLLKKYKTSMNSMLIDSIFFCILFHTLRIFCKFNILPRTLVA